MKHLFYILFLAGLLFMVSCKKESTGTSMPIVSPKEFPDSLFYPFASFTFVSPAGGGSSAIDTPYYYLPAVIRLSTQSRLTTNYEWYLRRQGVSDSLVSTIMNPVINYYSSLSNASIILIAKNGLGSTTVSKPFKIKNAPNGLIIKSIIIDTMSFINPTTSLPWNSVGGANVFCQIFNGSGTTVIMDTVNGPGWSSAPAAVANIFPVKTNLSTTPYTIKYPSGIKSFTISSTIPGVTLLDSFKVKIFNKNTLGTADLIGEVDLTPSNYFGGVLPTTIYINNPALNIYLKLSVQWL